MVEILPNWHPILVHFSVALLSISALLFVLTKVATNWRLEDQWLAAAYWNLWLGVLLSIGTVIAGVVAFNTVKHDDPSHLAMLDHRLWALVAAGAFAVLAIWGLVQYKSQKAPSAVFVVAMVLGLGVLLSAAWRGGELVYRHGLGVMALPNQSNHSHGAESSHAQSETTAPAAAATADVMAPEGGDLGEGHAPAAETHEHMQADDQHSQTEAPAAAATAEASAPATAEAAVDAAAPASEAAVEAAAPAAAAPEAVPAAAVATEPVAPEAVGALSSPADAQAQPETPPTEQATATTP